MIVYLGDRKCKNEVSINSNGILVLIFIRRRRSFLVFPSKSCLKQYTLYITGWDFDASPTDTVHSTGDSRLKLGTAAFIMIANSSKLHRNKLKSMCT